MSYAADQAEAIRAIAKIIAEQAVLERYQRSSKASKISITDGQVHAYDKILCVMKPFMDSEGQREEQRPENAVLNAVKKARGGSE
jgi:phosphopantothenate synthetase